MFASPSDLFTQLSSSCRKANEALSQAENLSGQFAIIVRRGTSAFAAAKSAQFAGTSNNTTSSNSSEAEELIAKIETAIKSCTSHCEQCRQSPLWVPTMELLQSLSPLQRQRVESTRHDVGDVEKQVRVLSNRHQQAVIKYRNANSGSNYDTSSSGGGFSPLVSSSSSSFAAESASSHQFQQHNRHQQQQQYGTAANNRVAAVLSSSRQKQQQHLTPMIAGDGSAVDHAAAEQEHNSKERESIQRVTTGVRQLVTESNAVLGALRQQRARMTDTDSRMSQVLSAAGVAQSVVKQLERMTVVDRIIVFGGMFVISLFMVYLWFFV